MAMNRQTTENIGVEDRSPSVMFWAGLSETPLLTVTNRITGRVIQRIGRSILNQITSQSGSGNLDDGTNHRVDQYTHHRTANPNVGPCVKTSYSKACVLFA